MAEPTDNSPIDAIYLKLPASYATTELPAAWRSRYGKKDINGAYITTTFAMLRTDPEVKIPNIRIQVSPAIYIAKLDRGFTRVMLGQIITANVTNPDVDLLDWTDARALILAARAAGIG